MEGQEIQKKKPISEGGKAMLYIVIGAMLAVVVINMNMGMVASSAGSIPIVCNVTVNSATQPTAAAQEPVVPDYQPPSMDAFTKCLTGKGMLFYGAYWCPHCNNMKSLFGDSMANINYIECDTGNNTMTQECKDAGIEGFPTFKIGNQTLVGEQTLRQLADATGCV